MQHVRRHTRFVKQLHGTKRNQRRLFCRFCKHRVTCRKRRSHLTRKYRQRKIPRTDADEYATTAQTERIALARWPRQYLRLSKQVACPGRVIAQEVHGLAKFRHCIGYGLAGFYDAQRQ